MKKEFWQSVSEQVILTRWKRRLTCSKRSLQKRLKKLLYTGRLQAI